MTTIDTAKPVCVTSLRLLGDYWTLRIINALEDGEQRYCEVQRAADNLNPVTLTGRLKKLEQAGLISRTVSPNDRHNVRYALTDLGTAAIPVLQAVSDFSGRLRDDAQTLNLS